MTTETPVTPPPCPHEWKFVDDSFSHEFGVEKVHYFECELCGLTRDVEASDYDAPEDNFDPP